MKAKVNAIKGILHTPPEFKPLINSQTTQLSDKPSAEAAEALGKLAAPLAQAVQKEAAERYKWNQLQKNAKIILDPTTLLEAMEKDEHWADEESDYGITAFLWLCDYFDDNIDEDDVDNNDDNDNDSNSEEKKKKKKKKKKSTKKKKKNEKKKMEKEEEEVEEDEMEYNGLFDDDDEWADRLKHWRGARKVMKTYLKRANLKSAGDVCVWIMNQQQFGDMSCIVKIALFFSLVPPTTVPVERGFSIRNQIKTAIKNRMLVDLLEAIMLINTETGSRLDKKIARRAAEIWLWEEGKTRRNLDSLKYEIQKECKELLIGLGNEHGRKVLEGEDEELEEEGKSKTAVDIVFEKENLKRTLKELSVI